jgi:alcohol oxidase
MNVQYLEYPASRGTIHITSKDFSQTPDFDAGFLSHPADLSPQVWAYKRNREIIRQMSSFQSEYAPSHPSFPVGSAAACNAKDPLEYTKEDDAAIEDWVRQGVETTWHSMYNLSTLFSTNIRGTCAMKPRAEGGVVDKHLNVYGTQNLKIAGDSTHVAANHRSFNLSGECGLKYV